MEVLVPLYYRPRWQRFGQATSPVFSSVSNGTFARLSKVQYTATQTHLVTSFAT